jgi:hypothetical protein
MMEVASISETPINFYQTARCNIPEDSHPHTRLRENLKSHQFYVCFQNIVLPKLPVPNLEQTLERYLATIKPIVSDSQYERMKVMVKGFGSSTGQGPRLQEKLLQLREEHDNWVSRIRA